MAETFGHRWSSQQGPAPNDTWVRACADLTGQQIATALAVIIERGGEWPPALPEFRQIALSGADPTAWERRCHKPISMDGLLENKTAAEKRKAEGRAQMRSLRAQIGL